MPVYDVANKDYLYTEAWIDKLEVARRFTGISNHRRRSARFRGWDSLLHRDQRCR
jgi:hypothetical protein